MKWTGIKDKDGKKIYIGSIVFEPTWWWGSGVVEDYISYGGQDRKYVIRCQDGHLTHNYWDMSSIVVVNKHVKKRCLINTKNCNEYMTKEISNIVTKNWIINEM